MQSKFNLICRWSYPESHGGIAMHNYYLLKALQDHHRTAVVLRCGGQGGVRAVHPAPYPPPPPQGHVLAHPHVDAAAAQRHA